jgi:hypothetical protein
MNRGAKLSFYGQDDSGRPIALDPQHPAHLNLANGNARVFLLFLGLAPGSGPDGDAAIADVRRAIMRARATFDRRAPKFTRRGSDTKRPGRCRVIESELDAAYLERRLHDLERFVEAVVERGASSVYWA